MQVRASSTSSGDDRRVIQSRRAATVAMIAGLLASLLGPAVVPALAVVNGVEVSDLDARWPFIVSVGTETTGGCGGALIHPEWVLTAGHCAEGITHVHHGDVIEADRDTTPVEQIIEYPAPWWDPTSFDLALVQLQTALELRSAVLGTQHPDPGDVVWVAGWGATDVHGAEYPDVLHEGATTVRDETQYPGQPSDVETMIWAGGLAGDADACYADSGGPLVDDSGRLVGIVSRAVAWSSTPCGDGGLYADVTHPAARAWIEQLVPDTFDAQAPTVAEVGVAPEVAALGSPVTVTATVDDTTTGGSAIVSASVTLADAAAVPMTADDGDLDEASEAVTATLVPDTAGLAEVCVTATDDAGNVAEPSCAPLAMYDPDGGFAVGSGVVDSPTEADPVAGAEGPARFLFVSKYVRGRTTPDGPFQFQFEDGDLSFRSTGQAWLVVTGEPRARFQGTGVLNGTVACQYTVDAWDGAHPTGDDAFGLQLFGCDGPVADRYDLAAQPLTRGAIRVHRR